MASMIAAVFAAGFFVSLVTLGLTIRVRNEALRGFFVAISTVTVTMFVTFSVWTVAMAYVRFDHAPVLATYIIASAVVQTAILAAYVVYAHRRLRR